MRVDDKRDKFMRRVRQSFLDHGYDQQTMNGLAKSCDVTPRALYNYFSGKEDAYRETLRWSHAQEIAAGVAAGAQAIADGGSASDAIVAILDARYDKAARSMALSPHAAELTYETMRRCRDVLVDTAAAFQDRLAEAVADLAAAGLLSLKPDTSAADLAQLIADGARGINLALPPPAGEDLVQRYRRMCAALLRGTTLPAERRKAQEPARARAQLVR